jgi:uncharacterized membrane protein YtjA (UPF0391 family)
MTIRTILLFIALILFVIAFICSLPTPGTFVTLGAQSWAIAAFIACLIALLFGERRFPTRVVRTVREQ